MTASTPLLSLVLLTLIFSNTLAAATDTPTPNFSGNDDNPNEQPPDSSWKIELEQLNSRILLLESSISERSKEIKSKDETIKQLQKIIQEKSATLASLQNEAQAVQHKGYADAKEQMGLAQARASELEKQVEKLKEETAQQNIKKEALETRANIDGRKIEELNLKLENLQRINNEQKIRIRKTEHALQGAEEEMMRVQYEATEISQKLLEVQGAWLPHWFAVHLVHLEAFMVTHWNAYGRPALDLIIQKALAKKGQFQKWAEPQLETLNANWIPGIKEQWLVFVTAIQPNIQLLTVKAVEIYQLSKDMVRPHFVNAQKVVLVYFQEAKKFTKPYINQVSKVMKPHIDGAHIVLKPYIKKVLRGHRKFVKMIMVYHRQVHVTIHEILTSHESTAPFATNELEWFMASALMVLPGMFLLRKISAIFWKRPKKRVRLSHTSHTRRRAKRVHSDK